MAKLTPVATFPAKTAASPAAATAIPPTVVAKGKRGFAALAEGVPGAKPARKAAAKPAAKKKDALTVLADQTTAKKAAAKPAAKKAEAPKRTVGDKLNAAARTKAPAKPRSAAAKRAEPAPTKKVATKAAKPATAPAAKPAKGEPTQHQVKNVAGLIKFLSTMPSGGGFDVERKFGKAKIQVKNIRGRVIAEVQQIAK